MSMESDRNILLRVLVLLLFDDDQGLMLDQFHLHSSAKHQASSCEQQSKEVKVNQSLCFFLVLQALFSTVDHLNLVKWMPDVIHG